MAYYHPFRHLGLKAIAVALSALLWLTVTREPIVERTLRVPLQFQSIPTTLEMVGEPLATVTVRVRGSSGAVSRLEPGQVLAVVDLAGARAGSRLFHLLSDHVQAPFDIEIIQVQPTTIALEFERSLEKRVPVEPAVEGLPAPGYVIKDVTTDPSDVVIVGPASLVRQVSHATTEPVTVQDATATVLDSVTIGVTEADIRLKSPETARVQVTVVPAPIERRVEQIPLRMHDALPGVTPSVTPTVVDVQLRGTEADLDRWDTEAVHPYVDLEGLGPGRYSLPVKYDAKPDIEVLSVEPSQVQVRIR
jgi:YbbR domain-containing protein